jgi:hypothetical protein
MCVDELILLECSDSGREAMTIARAAYVSHESTQWRMRRCQVYAVLSSLALLLAMRTLERGEEDRK